MSALSSQAEAMFSPGVAMAASAGKSGPPGRRKRFLWSEPLHKHFIACIFDFGLKSVTPRLLFDLMQVCVCALQLRKGVL